MQNENGFDKLLIRYLSDETNEAENESIQQWINASENNRQYFEQLQNVYRLIHVQKQTDEINIDYEWTRFTTAVPGNLKTAIPDTRDEVTTYETEIETAQSGRTAKVYRILISAAIAASVIIAFGLVFNWFGNKAVSRPALAETGTQKTDSIISLTRHEKNTSGKIQQIDLQDGSEVMLFNSSELTYQEPFTGNKREITMSGKAEFKVAKDSTKPFIVYSGDISTTALGTQFSVTHFEGEKSIIVRLYEGKIVISSVTGAKRKLNKDYYLLPGQELVYDQHTSTAVLKNFTIDNNGRDDRKGEVTQGENPTIPLNEKGSWYMFNNQSLAQVFDQLQDMYNVKIEYVKKDVRDKYFIGKFDKTDSVERILRQITSLNNLKLIKENNKFIITK
jgi:transmembrane sensor